MERVMEQRVNVKFCVKLKKSSTGQTPVHGAEMKEFPPAKEATDIKVHDRKNVDVLFRHQGYHPP
jgi:hypothetical protein